MPWSTAQHTSKKISMKRLAAWRKVIRRESYKMGIAHMKMRMGDMRIANECENIQHDNGYENVPESMRPQQK